MEPVDNLLYLVSIGHATGMESSFDWFLCVHKFFVNLFVNLFAVTTKPKSNRDFDAIDLGDLVVHLDLFPLSVWSICNDKLYQCNWHLFPIEIQRMLVIVMTNTQRPSTVHGFANTFCTRDAFKGVKFRVTWEEMATIHVLLIFLRAFVDRSGRILLFHDDASNWWQSSWIGYGFEFFRMRQPSHEWSKQCLGKSLLAMKRNPKSSIPESFLRLEQKSNSISKW